MSLYGLFMAVTTLFAIAAGFSSPGETTLLLSPKPCDAFFVASLLQRPLQSVLYTLKVSFFVRPDKQAQAPLASLPAAANTANSSLGSMAQPHHELQELAKGVDPELVRDAAWQMRRFIPTEGGSKRQRTGDEQQFAMRFAYAATSKLGSEGVQGFLVTCGLRWWVYAYVVMPVSPKACVPTWLALLWLLNLFAR